MTPIAEICLPATLPMFAGHFPGNPIVPGAYLLALVQQHVQRWLAQQGGAQRVVGVTAVKFIRPVRPDETFTIAAGVPSADALRFRISTGDAACANGTLTLAAHAAASGAAE
jgi:3-hydroxymyristoyl/3-hydroxydecanoyl-(acyl carrier protein) dehydratase